MLKTITNLLCSISLAAISTGALAAKGEPWITDMAQAQKTAQAEGKDIFVYFTGSDWCAWCLTLDKEVFSQPEFIEYAKKNWVLVELDFPNDEDLLTEEQIEHNEKWEEVFQPPGFPTAFLTDHNAQSYATVGYREGGAQLYVDHLQALRSGKTASERISAALESAQGLERARLLDEQLTHPGIVLSDNDITSKREELLALAKGQDDTLFNKHTTLQSEGDIHRTIRGINLFLSNEPEVKLERIQQAFNDYKHLNSNPSLHPSLQKLLANVGDSFIQADKRVEGVKFMDGVISDDSQPVLIRQSAALFKGIINAHTTGGNEEDSLSYYDDAIAIDPTTKSAKRAQDFKEKLLDGGEEEAL